MTIEKTQSAKRRVKAVSHSGPPATVTVVIPCFNYARFLTQAVESALQQEEVSVDVIIVDDKSTDDSLAVAHGLMRLHTAVKVVENPYNRGPVETFNAGVAGAAGEFLVRLDADDMLTPGSLKRAVDVARSFPRVGLIYGHPLHFSGATPPAARIRATGWTVWAGQHWLRERCLNGYNVITSPEVVMRRSAVQHVGPQQPLKHAHDMEMWLRISAYYDVAYIHGADQAWHREHPESLSAREVDELVDFNERAEAFEVLFTGIAAELPGSEGLHRTARRTLANQALDAANHECDCGRGDGRLVQDFVESASLLVEDIRRLPGWNRLQKRSSLGAFKARSPLASLRRRAWRRLSDQVAWWRWHRQGVF